MRTSVYTTTSAAQNSKPTPSSTAKQRHASIVSSCSLKGEKEGLFLLLCLFSPTVALSEQSAVVRFFVVFFFCLLHIFFFLCVTEKKRKWPTFKRRRELACKAHAQHLQRTATQPQARTLSFWCFFFCLRVPSAFTHNHLSEHFACIPIATIRMVHSLYFASKVLSALMSLSARINSGLLKLSLYCSNSCRVTHAWSRGVGSNESNSGRPERYVAA